MLLLREYCDGDEYSTNTIAVMLTSREYGVNTIASMLTSS